MCECASESNIFWGLSVTVVGYDIIMMHCQAHYQLKSQTFLLINSFLPYNSGSASETLTIQEKGLINTGSLCLVIKSESMLYIIH